MFKFDLDNSAVSSVCAGFSGNAIFPQNGGDQDTEMIMGMEILFCAGRKSAGGEHVFEAD
jgi:hypothetical protein